MKHQIGIASTVTLHLSLTLEDGTVAESTFGEEPLVFTMGDGSLVHGLELDESRVNTAAGLCTDYPESHFFFHANLDEWHALRDVTRQVLLPNYDIVLYLGIQHHLARPQRLATLADAIAMANRVFAVRTTADVYREDNIDDLLSAAGFEELTFDKAAQRDGFGVARIFLKR